MEEHGIVEEHESLECGGRPQQPPEIEAQRVGTIEDVCVGQDCFMGRNAADKRGFVTFAMMASSTRSHMGPKLERV